MASSSVVSYGRRKGSLRTPPELTKKRDQTPLRPGQVAVVPGSEWLRIRNSIKRDTETKPVNERKNLHEMSKSIVKNWENTIEGQRLKKLQARKIREDNEEAERVKVDIEEAKFQAEKRKEAIEKAKTLLYHQTDRVKQFHGALLLSEVLRERDQQVLYKQRKEEFIKGQDAKYVEFEKGQRETAIKADMQAALRRAEEKDKVSKYQIEQANKKASLRATDRQAALAEQKQLDQEVSQFHEQQRELEARQRENKLLHRKELDDVLEQKVSLDEAHRQREKQEDQEIKIFANAKKKMTVMRKAKEKELFETFQTQQQKMCEQLQGQMAQATSNEDERIAKAIAEQYAKKEAEERVKQDKFVAMSRDIFSHMKEQLNEQARLKQEQEQHEQDLLQQRVAQDQKFHNRQVEKQRKAKEEALDTQDYLRLQMKELSARRDATITEESDSIEKNMELLKVEEGQFQQYATDVINKAHQRGAPVGPLYRAAQPGAGGGHGRVFSGKGGIRPSYQTTDSTAVELPSYLPKPSGLPNTQKRMGFTW